MIHHATNSRRCSQSLFWGAGNFSLVHFALNRRCLAQTKQASESEKCSLGRSLARARASLITESERSHQTNAHHPFCAAAIIAGAADSRPFFARADSEVPLDATPKCNAAAKTGCVYQTSILYILRVGPKTFLVLKGRRHRVVKNWVAVRLAAEQKVLSCWQRALQKWLLRPSRSGAILSLSILGSYALVQIKMELDNKLQTFGVWRLDFSLLVGWCNFLIKSQHFEIFATFFIVWRLNRNFSCLSGCNNFVF